RGRIGRVLFAAVVRKRHLALGGGGEDVRVARGVRLPAPPGGGGGVDDGPRARRLVWTMISARVTDRPRVGSNGGAERERQHEPGTWFCGYGDGDGGGALDEEDRPSGCGWGDCGHVMSL
ncbi:hypothetical protein THAOC_24053, partial [Thalassiosira oceanica]